MTDTHYPDHWPTATIDTYDSVMAESPELSGAAYQSLVEACELLAVAYSLDAVAKAANYVSKGSMGQDVLHPAVAEARLSRTEAARILARLIGPTSKGQALARARHGGVLR
ncbi:hypothetical protein [Microbacterium sp.]|uniref:hypothetical protein n=1 Tax=Microbacterium sp. TaxID=51671 RepID=UPI002811C655|nr:hypothetical protein [Microbacterium sp.]